MKIKMFYTCCFLRLFVPLFILASLCPAPGRCDEWAAGKQEHPPTSPENRIIKWCEINGARVRYSSANIQIQGYEPCGSISAQTSCDPVGTKFISKNDNTPPAYRDCAIGPRIFILRHDDPTTKHKDLAASSSAAVPGGVAPLSMNEQSMLKKKINDLVKKQRQEDPVLALEQILLPFLTAGEPTKDLKQVDSKELEQRFQVILKGLDPRTKANIKKIVGPEIYQQFVGQ